MKSIPKTNERDEYPPGTHQWHGTTYQILYDRLPKRIVERGHVVLLLSGDVELFDETEKPIVPIHDEGFCIAVHGQIFFRAAGNKKVCAG